MVRNHKGGGNRQPKAFYNRPLTPEEAQFAADNIDIVWKYLDRRGLDRNEWFDVVIFRYMLSVKRYLCIPELQKYKFITVAYNAMQSAIGGEYAKRERRFIEVSLDSIAPHTNNRTYEAILVDPDTVESIVFA